MDNNNFYNYNNPDQFNSQNQDNGYTPPPQRNGMSTASLVLGIIAMVLCCCFYFSIPLGALGIIFAILSKGSSRQMSGRAKTGLGLSIASVCLSILLVVGTIATVGLSSFNQQMRDYMEYYYGDYYDQYDRYDDYDDDYRSPQPQYDIGDSI